MNTSDVASFFGCMKSTTNSWLSGGTLGHAWFGAMLLSGLLAVLACKNADYVNPGGTAPKPTPPTTATVISSTTATSPPTATTGNDSSSVSGPGLLRRIIQSGPAGSLTTTFGYVAATGTPLVLTSYTTVSGEPVRPASLTVLIVTLTRTGSLVSSLRENRSAGNTVTSGQQTFQYTPQGQLLTIDRPGTFQEQYTYDPSGALVGWQRRTGSASSAQEASRADITWRSNNVRLIKQTDPATGSVEEITWQADNLTNYRRRFCEQQGLPLRFTPGFDGADLLSANNPTEASEQFSGRRLRFTYKVGTYDQLSERVIWEWGGGQWNLLATETYRYY